MKKVLYFLLIIMVFPLFIIKSQSANNKSKADNSQGSEKMSNKRYTIDRYQISPSEKTVYIEQMTGGTDVMRDGSVINWHGSEYVPIEEIDFDRTSLMFIGGTISFKESSRIESSDHSALEVIFHSLGYDENITVILSRSENKVIVVYYDNGGSMEIDIKGYTHVRDVIFKNNSGELFYIPYKNSRLCPITLEVDEATLKHATYNYFYDKNGLYILDDWGKYTQCLESGNGIEPVLYDLYLTYGDAVYPYGHTNNNHKDTKMDLRTLMQFSSAYDDYITDGNKTFLLPDVVSVTPRDIIQENTPYEPIKDWRNIDLMVIGGNREGNKVYFSSKDHYAGSGSYYCIIKTSNSFFGITGSSFTRKAERFDDVLIWDAISNKYESIDIDHFRRLTTNFYIYKNRLYSSPSKLVNSDLDLEKLQPIRLRGKSTKFFTDGKYLLGGYNFAKNLQDMFSDVDWETLKVLRADYMADKNNIYKVTNSVLEVIPIKALELNVIIK